MSTRLPFGWFGAMLDWVRRLITRRRVRGRPAAGRRTDSRPYPWEASYPNGLAWDLDIRPEPVFRLLDHAVARYGDSICLGFFGKKYTYHEVGDLVAKAAKGFQDLGVRKGVRVGLLLPNCPFFVICYQAILKAGGTVVNYNPLYAGREIERQIRDSGTRIMVTMNLAPIYPKVAAALDATGLETIVVCRMSGALPFPGNALFSIFKRRETTSIPDDARHVAFAKLIDNRGDYEAVAIVPHHDVAVLQFTGGTTGRPKAAMLTHANLYANAVQTRIWASGLKLGEEKILAVLPLFHVFGMTGVMNVGLNAGAQLILLPRFKVSEVLGVIHKERPTAMLGVPTMYSAITGHKDIDRYDLSSLRICISGGAPLPRAIKTAFEALTGCVLVEGYGLTEAGPVCTINPITGVNKPESAGLPLPGTVIEVMSLDDADTPVPAGERGEICVTGPQVMAGYMHSDAETADALRNGRLHTGDVGYMDEDGYVFLIDRIKDMIITGGFNVYPRMVEEAIQLHPDVADAAVCGVPNTHHGELVKAYVVVAEGAELSAAELRRFLKDKLAPFEQPRRIEFLDAIPKTMLGKPLRRELISREMAEDDDQAEAAPADAEPIRERRLTTVDG